MRTLLTSLLLVTVSAGILGQEAPKPDANSLEVVVRGCANGRALVPQDIEGNVATPPTLVGKTLRLNGPKEVLNGIKKEKGRLIEITGLVRKSDLQKAGPGVVVGRTRIGFGTSPMTSDPTRADPARQAMVDVVNLDASGFRVLSTACSAPQR
jgi:hypothetical protein